MIEANNIWDKKVKNDGTEKQETKRDGVGHRMVRESKHGEKEVGRNKPTEI